MTDNKLPRNQAESGCTAPAIPYWLKDDFSGKQVSSCLFNLAMAYMYYKIFVREIVPLNEELET